MNAAESNVGFALTRFETGWSFRSKAKVAVHPPSKWNGR